jgi:hypothetical protein
MPAESGDTLIDKKFSAAATENTERTERFHREDAENAKEAEREEQAGNDLRSSDVGYYRLAEDFAAGAVQSTTSRLQQSATISAGRPGRWQCSPIN